MLVCVIDDDAEDRELFNEALKVVDPDIEFVEFNRIPSAIEHFRELKSFPSFVFLDAHLPSGNSTDVIREIRSEKKMAGVKIFIYSGYVTDEERSEFKKNGATDVITKPNQFNELKTLLARVISMQYS